MINTLLEHVPIKMEIRDVDEEPNENPVNDLKDSTGDNDKRLNETDEDVSEDDDEEDDEDEDDEEDDEEESDIEADALEIEQEATMLISSDEEAELEAQRIRFPDKILTKKLRSDSQKSSRTSSRNSMCSSKSSNSNSKNEINLKELPAQNENKKQRISPRLKTTENNKSLENLSKENNSTTSNNNNNNANATNSISTKKNADNKNMDNNKIVENNNNKNKQQQENVNKSPVNVKEKETKSRRVSNNSTCSVASTVASDSTETESCGNIYVFNLQQKLIFNCEFCDLKYGDLENFGRHLHEAHKLFNVDEDPEKENAPRNLRKKQNNCNTNTTKNATSVKKEPLYGTDSVAESPVALPLSMLAEPLDSCGNVFMLNHRKLFLVCGYCESKYANLQLFEKHLRQQHRIFEGCRNEVNVVPKIEVKDEVCIVSEVTAQQEIVDQRPMVAIPADTPLDISINTANKNLTEKALEESETCNKQTNKEPEISSSNNSNDGVNDCPLIAKENEIVPSATLTETENLPKSMEVENSVTSKKARNKRCSSPVKSLNSPNKRPKRNTRNKINVQEEKITTLNVEEKVPEETSTSKTIISKSIIPTTTPTVEETTLTISETAKATENKDTSKASKSKTPKKKISDKLLEENEYKEPKQTAKRTKPIETEKPETSTTETKKLDVTQIESKQPDATQRLSKKPDTRQTENKNSEITPTETKKLETGTAENPQKTVLITTTTQPQPTTTTEITTKTQQQKLRRKSKVKEPKKENLVESTNEIKELKRKAIKLTDTETEPPNKKSRETSNKKTTGAEPQSQPELQLHPKPQPQIELLQAIPEPEVKSKRPKMQCSHCDKTYTRKSALETHELLHIKEKQSLPVTQNIHQQEIEDKVNLKRHILKMHKGEKHYFTCGICGRDFSTKIYVHKHIEREHSAELDEGLQDDEEIAEEDELEKDNPHASEKTIKENPKLKIKNIQKVETENITLALTPAGNTVAAVTLQGAQLPLEKENFSQQDIENEDDPSSDPVDDIMAQLQNEILESEQQSAVTFTINTVPDEVSLNIPTKTVVSPSINPQILANDLNSPQDIKPTLLQIVKRFVCDQCPRSFDKHMRLVDHKRLHTGEKPFECEECGKHFRIRMRLKEHQLRHATEKKYKCEICQLSCATKQDLNLHMRHHNNDRRFQCSMCPKAFVRSIDLKIHVRVHTGEKPYVCDICHKCFRANQNLYVHKKYHMGEDSKSFKCEMCDKRFVRKVDRKVHMRSHTGEKPYKCEICQKGYSSRVNVRSHIERDHISANNQSTSPKTKKKPGPKPQRLREKLEKQKKLIAELQNQLLQQIKTDEKIIPCDEDMPLEDTLQDNTITPSSPINNILHDPIQSAYNLLNKLNNTATTSKPLTIIPSPPPLAEPSTNPFNKNHQKNTTTTTTTSLLPLTITQKIEQQSPSPSATSTASNNSLSCLTTPSPPKTTATKVVSQKTSLGIQQVSVTVSMQVENVTTPNPMTTSREKENAAVLTTSSSSNSTETSTPATVTNVKKERKITSYFTVVGQKGEV